MIGWHRKIFLSGIVLCVILCGIAMRTVPVSWDEGWNFCVARYWVEEGFFGCKYMGEPAIARLTNGPVTVGLAAAGFQLFGIGFLAGRIFFAVLTLGLLFLLLCNLTSKFFGKTAASYTPWVFCIASADQRINPIFLGSQAWGEIPSLLLFYVGILCLYYYRSSPASTLSALIVCPLVFSLATFTKAQFLPFISAGLTTILVISLVQREIRVVLITAVSLAACLNSSIWWFVFDVPLPSQASGSIYTLPSLTSLLAINLDLDIRVRAFHIFFREGLPAVASILLLYSMRKHLAALHSDKLFAFFLLFATALTWMGWFLLFSINFPRYLAPALVLSIPAISYGVSQLLERAREKNVRMKWIIPVVIGVLMLSNLKSLSLFIKDFWDSNNQLHAVVRFINEETPLESVIETYETQLFFLANRKLSYPSDLENFQSMLGQHEVISSYDPLRNNPDYIVLGLWSMHAFPFYNQLLSTASEIETIEIGDFRIIKAPR